MAINQFDLGWDSIKLYFQKKTTFGFTFGLTFFLIFVAL